jgi:hypothetical protein
MIRIGINVMVEVLGLEHSNRMSLASALPLVEMDRFFSRILGMIEPAACVAKACDASVLSLQRACAV